MEVVRRSKRDGNQVWQVMMKLMSNDEVDKLSWIIMKLVRKKRLRIKKKLVFRRRSRLIDHLQNISHQKVYTFWHCVVNDEVQSTSSKTVEQIQAIQGVVLTGISNMNGSGPDKKPKE